MSLLTDAIALVALASAPLQSPEVPATANRWALVVGISDYQNFADEVGGDLLGPANDARSVQEVLTARWGFPAENVRLLLDASADRNAIRSALTDWLPSVTRPGDLVVFYFAGHGSQALDENGDEADGLDETLAPYDVLRDRIDNDLTDDQLQTWLAALQDRSVVVILDSCHSGTGTRLATPCARPRVLGRRLPRADEQRESASQIVAGRALDTTPEGIDPLGEGLLEIAASQANQPAMDVAWPAGDGDSISWGGAFTTYLVEELWRAGPDATYEALFQAATRGLKHGGFVQDPLLSRGLAMRRHRAFHPGGRGADPAVRIQPITVSRRFAVDSVELSGTREAGLSQGMLVESEGQLLRVTSIRGDRATARPAEETRPGATALPTPGSTARIAGVPAPTAAITLSLAELEGVLREAALDALDDLPGLRLHPPSATVPDLLLGSAGSQYHLIGRDGAVRRSVVAEDLEALRRAVEWEISAHWLVQLRNPSEPSGLDVTIGEGTGRLRLGEAVEIRVRTGMGGFLTILDLAPDGAATLLHPNEFDPRGAIRAGEQIVLPSSAMSAAGIHFEAQEPVGAGVLRAFVTPEPLRLTQNGSGDLDLSAIARALEGAVGLAGGPSSDALRVEGWATAAVLYEILP